VLKYNLITLLKTVSTPQVAKAKMIENTATITIRFDDSAREGRVTLFLNSSTDSFIYVNILDSVLLFQQKDISSKFYCGTGGETRTPDTWFWRPVLYQLSYTRMNSDIKPPILLFACKGVPLEQDTLKHNTL
jgi:hypothetical protein|tara:strand:- start:462 stop:857 length:396 start_codon:yes stop_codon:yes gene_type:complete